MCLNAAMIKKEPWHFGRVLGLESNARSFVSCWFSMSTANVFILCFGLKRVERLLEQGKCVGWFIVNWIMFCNRITKLNNISFHFQFIHVLNQMENRPIMTLVKSSNHPSCLCLHGYTAGLGKLPLIIPLIFMEIHNDTLCYSGSLL